MALAWLLDWPEVGCGATRAGHLDDALTAVDLALSESEVDALEAG